MPESNIPGAPVPAGSAPASGGAAPSAPTIDLDALAAKLAEKVMPDLSKQVTGMGTRISASFQEKLDALAKGTPPAAPKADEPEGKDLPLKEQVSRLTKALEQTQKDAEAVRAREKSATIKAALEPLLIPGAAPFVVKEFVSLAQRGEDGEYYLKNGDETLSLVDGFRARMAALPDKGASILRAAGAAAGSGATDTTGKSAPAAASGFKSKREVTKDMRTNAKGEKVWEITPASTARTLELLAKPGGRDFLDALPDN